MKIGRASLPENTDDLSRNQLDVYKRQIKGSPKWWEYRNKMEFSFGDEVKGGPLALGMHKKNTFQDVYKRQIQCKL